MRSYLFLIIILVINYSYGKNTVNSMLSDTIKKKKIISDSTKLGYKTKVLKKKINDEQILIDKDITLNPFGSEDSSNITIMLLQLPKIESTEILEKELKGWAYWIGTVPEPTVAEKKDTVYKQQLASYLMGRIGEIPVPAKGDLVEYYIFNDKKQAGLYLQNKEFGYIDKGKAVAGYGGLFFKKGNYFISLNNPSRAKAIKVYVKVVAVIQEKEYEFREATIIQKN